MGTAAAVIGGFSSRIWHGVRRVHAASLPGLVALLIAMFLTGLGIGAFTISPAQSLAILLGRIGIDLPVNYSQQHESVLLAIRLPRVMMACLVGAALGTSGAVMQGIFRNPLASPGLIGVSSGAALGAAIVIAMGITSLGIWTLPMGAFAGALVTALGVYRFARRGGRVEVTTLLLVGIAVNALVSALISFLTYLSNDPQLRSIVFWMMGSVSGATWKFIGVSAPFILVSLALLQRYRRPLNLLALGDAEARHLGVDTERARLGCLILVSLATGAAVAVAGVVSFIGLVVPHVLRLLVGPDHRTLLPASALGGAILLMAADLFARTIVSPAQLPLGLVTSLIGAPFFLYLIERTRKAHGGWG